MCKCGNEQCTGYYLLHPAEFKDIPMLKEKELNKIPNAKFNLVISDPVLYTQFKELHVIDPDKTVINTI